MLVPQIVFGKELSGFGSPIIAEAIIQLRLELQNRKFNDLYEGNAAGFTFFSDFLKKHYTGFIESVSKDIGFMDFIIDTLKISPMPQNQMHFRELFKLSVQTRLKQLIAEQDELKITLSKFDIHPKLNTNDIREIKENVFTVLGTSAVFRSYLLNSEKSISPSVIYKAHLQSKNYRDEMIKRNNDNNNNR